MLPRRAARQSRSTGITAIPRNEVFRCHTQPSVTIALGELSERDLLVRRPDRTWRLSGDPPEEVFRLSRAGQRAAEGA